MKLHAPIDAGDRSRIVDRLETVVEILTPPSRNTLRTEHDRTVITDWIAYLQAILMDIEP